jgi:hypothetical protein
MPAEHPDANYLAQQVQKAGTQANLQAAQTMPNADRAVKQLRKMATQIYDTPETARVPIWNEPSEAGEPQMMGQTQKLSPTNKSQLLDRTYAWMQRISERGPVAIEQAR